MSVKKVKSKLERYEDVTGEFTSSELKWGEWYVRHKILLRKIVIGVLLTWCTITVSYGLGYFVYYFSYGYFQDEQMMNQQLLELGNYKNVQYLIKAKDLQVGNVGVYNSITENYDFLAGVKNPNERWLAIVTYKFTFSGGETGLAWTILLPGSQRPIAYFGFKSSRYPTNPSLVIEDIKWKKISPHAVPGVKEFTDERINFPVENFEFTQASESAAIPNNIIQFDVYNNTAYNYWEPSFYIELINGNRTVGVVYLVIDQFKSGEVKHIDTRSFVDNLEIDNVKVWPVINVFDENEFMSVDY